LAAIAVTEEKPITKAVIVEMNFIIYSTI